MGTLPDKIAFVTDSRGWGGAEVYLTQLMESLREAGIRPDLFCPDRRQADAWAADLESRGFHVARHRGTKEFNPLGFLDARAYLRGYDVVHVNKTAPRTSLPAVFAARSLGVHALVSTEHIAKPPSSHYPFGRWIITWLIRLANGAIDRVIAVSETSRYLLIKNYALPPEKVVAIRNGIDVSRFDADVDVSAVRSGLGLSEDDWVAEFIGRFSPGKGHDCALDAISLLAPEFPRLKLVLMGDGALEAVLRERAEELGVQDRVVFAGFVDDVPSVLAAGHALILPSESEGLPLSVLEAMAARLPVIASDVGGVAEAVRDGVTGVLISPRDPNGLSRALRGLMADPERARGMGEAGRRRVEEEFSSEASVGAVLRLYDEVLTREGDGR